MKNYIFLHIVKINDYQRIVNEIFEFINKELTKIEKIFIVILGDKDKNIQLPDINKIEIIYQSEDISQGEIVTLNMLHNFCKKNINNDNICYLHLKGVGSNNLNECINDWRKYMLYFIIEKIDNCIKILENHDTCGVDLRDDPTLHYSGNYWWGKSKYISELIDISDLPLIISERHKCEFWICSLKTAKHKSMHDCGINVYSRHLYRYEKNNYVS